MMCPGWEATLKNICLCDKYTVAQFTVTCMDVLMSPVVYWHTTTRLKPGFLEQVQCTMGLMHVVLHFTPGCVLRDQLFLAFGSYRCPLSITVYEKILFGPHGIFLFFFSLQYLEHPLVALATGCTLFLLLICDSSCLEPSRPLMYLLEGRISEYIKWWYRILWIQLSTSNHLS